MFNLVLVIFLAMSVNLDEGDNSLVLENQPDLPQSGLLKIRILIH